MPRRIPPAGQIGIALVVFWVSLAALGPVLAPFGAGEATGAGLFAPISAAHPFGTDYLGRDMLSRILHGARYTLLVAMAATTLALVAGSIVGALAGYFGGRVDMLLMRAVDFMMSFPSFLLAVVAVAILGKSLENLIWAVGIAGAPSFARQVRAEVLRIRALEFVEAAHSLGYGHLRILGRHIVPNCLTPIIVLGTLGMGGSILSGSGRHAN